MTIEHARREKAAKAAILRRLKEGTLTIGEAVRSTDSRISRLTLWEVLTAPAYMGPTRAWVVLHAVGVGQECTIGEIKKSQVPLILNNIPERHR